ncbi:SDR family oxidoreductase [Amycolatopsis jejuensis]|uniref:SDR family oxidoreductase n=1 Tax=Amycolatopsis jejuensis TaxID=330084 RepID=UPI000525F2FB|nr:SDR family oxidoreductase [Amycolatopsis jejuensis]
MTSLAGKSALVTGAGKGGLGYAAAIALARAGADIIVVEHKAGMRRAETTLADVLALGRKCVALEADVSDENQVTSAFEGLHVDVVVNAAGVMLRKPTVETSVAEWRHVLEVNVTGTWLVARELAPQMLERGEGRIINVASQYAALAGPLPEPAYYASKGAVANLTRGLASEWSRGGVTVNCIAPGVFYPTQMTEPLGADPDVLARMMNRTMAGRLGDPDRDLDGLVTFLAGPDSAYVTGAIMYADGGWSAW